MAIFKCKMCGGTIEFEQGATVGVCQYCGTKQTLPRLDDDRKTNLYDRANHFRRNNEYDKAMGIYEQILSEDNTDAESYWSLVLCKYGIEYVEDPATHKRVPTVNRAQYTSVFADEDYKSAIKFADGSQKEIYEAEARAIDEIQKGILEISQKEEPFDVFICYKETGADGRRTPDSVLATELYHELKREGFKVFFSRITLEDKLGIAYEPYIFAALNSSKVMVVLGTKAEYFNAVWVKNEWSRFLALIKSGKRKVLIPAYKDMDPYDLPEEFSHLQAQDMNKLGFMSDLVRGIKKIVGSSSEESKKETVVINSGNAEVEPLLKRAFIFLEDGDWNSANQYCERVLDLDPENANAYVGKLMVDLQIRKQEQLGEYTEGFENNQNYLKVRRYADSKLNAQLDECLESVKTANNEKIYKIALNKKKYAESESFYKEAAELFEQIGDYKNAQALASECRKKAEEIKTRTCYNDAIVNAQSSSIGCLQSAINDFRKLGDYKDSKEQMEKCEKRIQEVREENAVKARAAAKREKVKRIIIACVIGAVLLALFLYAIFYPIHIFNKGVEYYNKKDYYNAVVYMQKGKSYDSEGMLAKAEKALFDEAVENAKKNFDITVYDSFKLLDDYSYEDAKVYVDCYELMQKYQGEDSVAYFSDEEIDSLEPVFFELYLQGQWKSSNGCISIDEKGEIIDSGVYGIDSNKTEYGYRDYFELSPYAIYINDSEYKEADLANSSLSEHHSNYRIEFIDDETFEITESYNYAYSAEGTYTKTE